MSIKKFAAQTAITAVFAFCGGFAAQLLLNPGLAQAGDWQNFFQISDAKNTKGINSYISDGQPGQVFYGEDGKMRLQMGTYNGAGERGLPLMALSDNSGHIRLLFRLAGANESPVIVMKDKSGQDRLVMGLSMSNSSQDPFLSITDSSGTKTVFGTYN